MSKDLAFKKLILKKKVIVTPKFFLSKIFSIYPPIENALPYFMKWLDITNKIVMLHPPPQIL